MTSQYMVWTEERPLKPAVMNSAMDYLFSFHKQHPGRYTGSSICMRDALKTNLSTVRILTFVCGCVHACETKKVTWTSGIPFFFRRLSWDTERQHWVAKVTPRSKATSSFTPSPVFAIHYP